MCFGTCHNKFYRQDLPPAAATKPLQYQQPLKKVQQRHRQQERNPLVLQLQELELLLLEMRPGPQPWESRPDGESGLSGNPQPRLRRIMSRKAAPKGAEAEHLGCRGGQSTYLIYDEMEFQFFSVTKMDFIHL